MKLITKQTEPRKLAEHRSKGGTFSDFSLTRGKREVKEQLLKEQDGLCAYCMNKIHFDNMKVEHWKSQDDFPELQLHYPLIF